MEKKFRGHIGFRLPPERHEQLVTIAEILGIDLSALINSMLMEALPRYLEKATRILHAKAQAERDLSDAQEGKAGTAAAVPSSPDISEPPRVLFFAATPANEFWTRWVEIAKERIGKEQQLADLTSLLISLDELSTPTPAGTTSAPEKPATKTKGKTTMKVTRTSKLEGGAS